MYIQTRTTCAYNDYIWYVLHSYWCSLHDGMHSDSLTARHVGASLYQLQKHIQKQ